MDTMIGQRIKTLRKELGITGAQIKESTGISTGNLSGIENGSSLPSAAALIALSQLLGCTTDYILFGETPKSEKKQSSKIGVLDEDMKLLELFHGMSEDDQEELMMIAQMKYNRVKRDGKGTEKSSSSDHGKGTAETA